MENDTLNRDDLNLTEKMFRVEALLRRYHAYRFKSFGPFGNPMRGQGRVLSLLRMQPEISQKELSYLLDMRQQSLSELLAKLERSGFITRKPSESDKRVTMITLTEEGRRAAESAGDKEVDLGRVFGCLNEEEQRQFGIYLDKLANALEAELPDMCADAKAFGGLFGRAGGPAGEAASYWAHFAGGRAGAGSCAPGFEAAADCMGAAGFGPMGWAGRGGPKGPRPDDSTQEGPAQDGPANNDEESEVTK